jgi:hypothetical protein
MKKYISIPVAAIIMLLSACNSNSGTATPPADNSSATAKKNTETARAINKAVITGDVNSLGNWIAADGIDHAGDHGDVKGLDSIKASLANLGKAVTDMKTDYIHELADDEYVFQWVKQSGTMKLPGWGLKAGDHYGVDAIEISRFNKEGKSTEHWEFMQLATLMQMMGGQQPGNQH